MTDPEDEEYQETKLIKRGKLGLASPFRELANWIEATYSGVAVLNARCDRVEGSDLHRLSVIVETPAHELVFRDGANYRRIDQDRVTTKFRELLFAHKQKGPAPQKVFVIFVSFEEVARIEANWKVSKGQISALKLSLGACDLWEIWPSLDEVTFFFHTDDQLAASALNGAQEACRDGYRQLIAPHDEFGYIAERPITVNFDSKENLDRNYEGNLFLYDRR